MVRNHRMPWEDKSSVNEDQGQTGGHISQRPFHRLRGLRLMRVSSIRQLDTLDGYWLSQLDACVPEARMLMAASVQTLRELCIFDTLLVHVPDEVLGRLTVLELWAPRARGDALERICARCQRLEGLALVDVSFHTLAPVLSRPSSVKALPCLTSFKLMSLDPAKDEESVGVLVLFLKSKRYLRRLDINLPGMENAAMIELLIAISRMRHLRYLALDARTLTEQEDVETMADLLPRKLIGFHIQTCFEKLPLDAEEILPLVRLRYGH
jgi:hypothetical protein